MLGSSCLSPKIGRRFLTYSAVQYELLMQLAASALPLRSRSWLAASCSFADLDHIVTHEPFWCQNLLLPLGSIVELPSFLKILLA